MHGLNNPSNMRLWNTIRRGYRFRNAMENAIQRLKIPDNRRKRLMALLGIQGHCSGLPASDIDARIRSMEILYRATGDYLDHEINADEELFLVTSTCDTGLTNDRAPHLRLKTFIGKTYRQIHANALNAICSIEIQALTNYPTAGSNALMLHAHALSWGKIPAKARQAAVRKANSSRAWANHFDAPSVLFRRPQIELGGAKGWAGYMSELPDYAKRICVRPNGKIRFENHVSGYPASLALRIMEGLSYFSIPDLVFGVGDGKYLRREWVKELRAWSSERDAQEEPEPDFDIAEAWNNLPSPYYRRHFYEPYRIN